MPLPENFLQKIEQILKDEMRTCAATGHSRLNKHLATISVTQDPNYSCGYGVDTGILILCNCPIYMTLRLKLLGKYFLNPDEVPPMGAI